MAICTVRHHHFSLGCRDTNVPFIIKPILLPENSVKSKSIPITAFAPFSNAINFSFFNAVSFAEASFCSKPVDLTPKNH